jgi:hypothetical protein
MGEVALKESAIGIFSNQDNHVNAALDDRLPAPDCVVYLLNCEVDSLIYVHNDALVYNIWKFLLHMGKLRWLTA